MNAGEAENNRRYRLLLHAWIAMGLAALLSVCPGGEPAVAEAYDVLSGDWGYILDEDGNAILTEYFGTATEIVLPDTIDGHTVTGLQRTFCDNNNLSKIVLPGTLTAIGNDAFRKCTALREISLPDSLEYIGDEAFAECQNLTEICVGSQLKRIGTGAFRDTPFWSEQAEWEDGAYYLGSYAVSIDENTRSEVLKIREGCTLIADSFSGINNQLKYLWLPDSLQYIGKDAFWYNQSLQEMIGGRSLKYIGENAFIGNRELERVLIRGEKVTIETGAFDFSSVHLSELMIDAEEVVLAEYCFGGGNSWDRNGISISTLVLPNLNIPLRKTGLASISVCQTKLLLANMSAEALQQGDNLFTDCEGLHLYLPESQEDGSLKDSLAEPGVSVFYREEWHLCRFLVYGAMKQLSILDAGEAVTSPLVEGEEYFVTEEGPLLQNIHWDLNGDGEADVLPESIHADIRAEALYAVREEKHDWQVKEVWQQQNCTQGGDVIYRCSGCGKEKQIQTEALEHDFSLTWSVDREASCREMGEKSHHCTREGCTERTAVTPVLALGHIWDAGEITIEPQVGIEGEKTLTCAVCGEQEKEVLAPLPLQTLSPDASELPQGTVTPQETELPRKTVAPRETETPQETKAPHETGVSQKTPMPQETGTPQETETPGETEIPPESALPEISEAPAESMLPGISKNSAVSAQPAPAKTGSVDSTVKITVSDFRAKSNYSKITLYWAKGNAGFQYWLYRSSGKNGRKKLLKKLTGQQTSYSDRKVAAGTSYYYQIRVVQSDGNRVKICGSSHLCKAALKVRKAPKVRISKKHQGNIRYLEISLKSYTGKYLEIFYRKRKMGAYHRLKLRSKVISKHKKFRIRYLSHDGTLFLRFRTYRKQGNIKLYSRYTAEKKVALAQK